jgi:hypothetical protein
MRGRKKPPQDHQSFGAKPPRPSRVLPPKRRPLHRSTSEKEIQTMPAILMWLIGIPIPIIILLLIFGVL